MAQQTVPCKICEEPTLMTGTRLCDGCWEVDRRLEGFLMKKGGRARVLEALKDVIDGHLERHRAAGFDEVEYDFEDDTFVMKCSQCEVCVINGLACHETGCPNQAAAKMKERDEECYEQE